ncbi:MAG TPA: FecR family protein [Sulfuricurvum sp.]|nr:FecR family protein [Sulfuricurvum sp.]
MKIYLFIFLVLVFIPSAQAAKPGEQAILWVSAQRDSAMGAVIAAQKRVDAAETDMRISRSVETDIRMSKDVEAMAVAREAVAISEQGLLEANALLKQAKSWLQREENRLASLQESVAKYGSDKALVIPIGSDVRRSMNGISMNADPSIPLRVGERVEVGSQSRARVFVAGGDAEVALSQNSSFTVTSDDTGESFEAILSDGFAQVRAKLKNYFGKKFEVRTPAAVCAVRGTDFSLMSTAEGTRIEVFEGVVWAHLPNSDKGIEIHAGEGCNILKKGEIQSVKPLENLPRENPWSDNVFKE